MTDNVADRLGGQIQPAGGFPRGARLAARRCPAGGRAPGARRRRRRADRHQDPARHPGRPRPAQDGEAINYQERAPLVIPPSHALPPPEDRCRGCQQSGLAERSRRQAAQARKPRRKRDQHRSRDAMRERSEPLRPDRTGAGAEAAPARIERRQRSGRGERLRQAAVAVAARLQRRHVRQDVRQGRAEISPLHRRAAAHGAHRAAAGLSDAVAGAALWRRQGEAATPKSNDYLHRTANRKQVNRAAASRPLSFLRAERRCRASGRTNPGFARFQT